MTNAEKYAEEIIDLARSGAIIGVNKDTNQPCNCSKIVCADCKFFDIEDVYSGKGCGYRREQWFDAGDDPLAKYRNLPIDSKVWVRDIIEGEWVPRHFAGIDDNSPNRPFLTYVNGYTSFTSKKYFDPPTTHWAEMKLTDTE